MAIAVSCSSCWTFDAVPAAEEGLFCIPDASSDTERIKVSPAPVTASRLSPSSSLGVKVNPDSLPNATAASAAALPVFAAYRVDDTLLESHIRGYSLYEFLGALYAHDSYSFFRSSGSGGYVPLLLIRLTIALIRLYWSG